MAPAIGTVKVPLPVRAGTGNATRFPRPRATLPCRSVGPGTTKGQRPTRRGRCARRGRVGRWLGALAPGRSRCQRGALAGAMAPAIAAVTALSSVRADQETRPAFPRPRATVPCRPADPGTTPGQRPTRRAGSARPGRVGRPPGAGRALAGGFGPRLAKDQRGAVAGAMAPARMRKAHTQVQEFPAFRSGSPCGRHLFRTPLTPGRSGWGAPGGRHRAPTSGEGPTRRPIDLCPSALPIRRRWPACTGPPDCT